MTVGIRELKANLSQYLKKVQNGATIHVTARGRTIATIQPLSSGREDFTWAHQMVADNLAKWSGGKPKGLWPPVKLKRGSRTAAEIVIDNRR